MACCGKARARSSGTAAGATPVRSAAPTAASRRPPVAPASVFEYVGTSGLTATGGVTRRTYVFAAPGARVAVDARDASGLRAIPVLRLVPPDHTL